MNIIGERVERASRQTEPLYEFPQYHSGSIAGQFHTEGFWKGLEAAESTLAEVFSTRPEIANEISKVLGSVVLRGTNG